MELAFLQCILRVICLVCRDEKSFGPAVGYCLIGRAVRHSRESGNPAHHCAPPPGFPVKPGMRFTLPEIKHITGVTNCRDEKSFGPEVGLN